MTSQEISSFVKDRILANNPEQAWIWDNLLFLHLAGSRLYGTSSDSSDWDVRGVTLAPKRFWVGAHTFEQMEIQLPESGMDVVIYDFRKWLHLTVNCNPNVIETLYVTRPEHILHSREPWPTRDFPKAPPSTDGLASIDCGGFVSAAQQQDGCHAEYDTGCGGKQQ